MATTNNVTVEEIRNEIKRMVAEVTERQPEEISDTALFREDLGVDSLMALEIMVSVDQRYQISLPEEEFKTLTNVAETVDLVQKCLAARAATA